MSDTALVVMARYPEEGKTKTRLARTLGDTITLGLYRAFLTDLAQRFANSSCDLYWTYTPADVDYLAFMASLVPNHAQRLRCFPQQGVDLDERLHYAFQWTAQHGYQRTIVIGSDSPHISQKIVADARLALNRADVVLGPADDGGYYLVAMRQPHNIFTGIPMSTTVVAQMTIALAKQQGLTVHLLESLLDVDEWPDLQRLAHLLTADSMLAPVTAAHLNTIRSIFDDYSTRAHTTTLNLYRADEPL